MERLARGAPVALAALRVMSALLFLEHGLMKLFGFPGPQPGAPTPLPAILMAAALIEVVGGALLAAGLFTRAVAFLCSGQMAVAYFAAYAPRGFWPGLNQGDAAILYCFVFLYLVFSGPGAFSLDALRTRRAAREP